MKNELWKIKMKNAHRMARRLSGSNYNTYRQNLSMALRVQHMLTRQITLADINWLMNYLGSGFVNLNLQHLKQTELFKITGGVNFINVEHYVKPRTKKKKSNIKYDNLKNQIRL